jgi:enamine deaminase RidA (YjgF/YER057c/UK114 family)
MILIKPQYQVLLPKNTKGFFDQWTSCFHQLTDVLKDGDLKPFRVNIFVHSEGFKDYNPKVSCIRQSFSAFLGNSCPPYTILPQAPEDPYQVIIEAGFYRSEEAEITYHEHNNQIYSHVKAGEYHEHWLIGVEPAQHFGSITKSAQSAFANLVSQFSQMGLSMNEIVRQWNYVGNILTCNELNGSTKQNYQLFNEVRFDTYSNHRNLASYPAATGIGTAITGISIDCLVINHNPDVKIIPISNPNQINSYQYGQEVLIGAPNTKKEKKHPPQFERAILITTGDSSRLLISGTAAIIGQHTVANGDVSRQTLVSIENIQMLCSRKNLVNHHAELTCIPKKYSYIRVYVSHRKDIPLVKPICQDFYGDVPINYLQADICRHDLLVEIEAEMIS